MNETATGWMNLAWDTAIDEAINYWEIEFLFGDFGKEHGKDKADEAIEKHWQAKRLKLNNAISLLQQSLEIFLKAKIAEVSPFLLITGHPQSWPSTDASGRIDFSDFKTLDAVPYVEQRRLYLPPHFQMISYKHILGYEKKEIESFT